MKKLLFGVFAGLLGSLLIPSELRLKLSRQLSVAFEGMVERAPDE
jgi:hypothetical protein